MAYAVFAIWNPLHTAPEVGMFAFGPLVRTAHVMRTKGIRYEEVNVSSRFGEQLSQRRWENEREGDVRYIFLDDRRCGEKEKVPMCPLYLGNYFLHIRIAMFSLSYLALYHFTECARNSSFSYLYFRAIRFMRFL